MRPIGPSAELLLLNAGSERQVTVSFAIEIESDSSSVTIVWPDGSSESVTPSPLSPISRTLVLAPGENRVEIVVDGSAGERGTAALIHDLWAVDPELLAFGESAVR